MSPLLRISTWVWQSRARQGPGNEVCQSFKPAKRVWIDLQKEITLHRHAEADMLQCRPVRAAKRLPSALQAAHRLHHSNASRAGGQSFISLPFTLPFPVRRSAQQQAGVSGKDPRQKLQPACRVDGDDHDRVEIPHRPAGSDTMDASICSMLPAKGAQPYVTSVNRIHPDMGAPAQILPQTMQEAATAADSTSGECSRPAGISCAKECNLPSEFKKAFSRDAAEPIFRGTGLPSRCRSSGSQVSTHQSPEQKMDSAAEVARPGPSSEDLGPEVPDGQAVACRSTPDPHWVSANDAHEPGSLAGPTLPFLMQRSSPTRSSKPSHCSQSGIDAGVACESPMVQPSPAPLRQRLGLAGNAFQPCRRAQSSDVTSEDGPLPCVMSSLDDVEVIEID